MANRPPDVLERLVISRDTSLKSVNKLIEAAYLVWARQMELVFDIGPSGEI